MTEAASRQRLDKWLFFARVVKSRTLAQKLIESGAVRVNGERATGSDLRVGPGDTLTMTVHQRLRVLEILDAGTRRGPASEAAGLYNDRSPELEPYQDPNLPPALHPGQRDKGAGRPTKQERRATDRLMGREPE